MTTERCAALRACLPWLKVAAASDGLNRFTPSTTSMSILYS